MKPPQTDDLKRILTTSTCNPEAIRILLEIGVNLNAEREYVAASRFLRRAADLAVKMFRQTRISLQPSGRRRITSWDELRLEQEQGVWRRLVLASAHRIATNLILKADFRHAELAIDQGLEFLGCSRTSPPVLPADPEGLRTFSILQSHMTEVRCLQGRYLEARRALNWARSAACRHVPPDPVAEAIHWIREAVIEQEDPHGSLHAAQHAVNAALDALSDQRYSVWWWTLAEMLHCRVHVALAREVEHDAARIQHSFAWAALDRAYGLVSKDRWRRLELDVLKAEFQYEKLLLDLDLAGGNITTHTTSTGSVYQTTLVRHKAIRESLDDLRNPTLPALACRAIGEHHHYLLAAIHYLWARCQLTWDCIERLGTPQTGSAYADQALDHLRASIQYHRLLGAKKARHAALKLLVQLEHEKAESHWHLPLTTPRNPTMAREASAAACQSGLAIAGLMEWKEDSPDELRQREVNVRHFLEAICGNLDQTLPSRGLAWCSRREKCVPPDQHCGHSHCLVEAMELIEHAWIVLGDECTVPLLRLLGDTKVEAALGAHWRNACLDLVKSNHARRDAHFEEAYELLNNVAKAMKMEREISSRPNEEMIRLSTLLDERRLDLYIACRGHPDGQDGIAARLLGSFAGKEAFARHLKDATRAYFNDDYAGARAAACLGLRSLRRLDSAAAAYFGPTTQQRYALRARILLGRVQAFRGHFARGLRLLARGIVEATALEDRESLADAYYVLGRVLFYYARTLGESSAGYLLAGGRPQLGFETCFNALLRAAREAIREARNRARKKPRSETEGTPVRSEFDRYPEMKWSPLALGISPLTAAWGLAEDHDMRLRASILHQRGRLEMERKNYHVAERYLVESFEQAQESRLEVHRINAAREIIRCWLLQAHEQTCGPAERRVEPSSHAGEQQNECEKQGASAPSLEPNLNGLWKSFMAICYSGYTPDSRERHDEILRVFTSITSQPPNDRRANVIAGFWQRVIMHLNSDGDKLFEDISLSSEEVFDKQLRSFGECLTLIGLLNDLEHLLTSPNQSAPGGDARARGELERLAKKLRAVIESSLRRIPKIRILTDSGTCPLSVALRPGTSTDRREFLSRQLHLTLKHETPEAADLDSGWVGSSQIVDDEPRVAEFNSDKGDLPHDVVYAFMREGLSVDQEGVGD